MGKPSRKFGKCPKCGTLTHLTRHHVLPRRFYKGKGEIVLFCRTCHNELELLIPVQELMPTEFYRLIVYAFINKENLL